jgi:PAS domain S-box-containing protein
MKKLGITSKLTLIFILFAGAVLAGLGIPAYNNGRTALKIATFSEIQTTTLEKQAALASWVTDRQHSIGDIASQTNLWETVTAFIAATPDSSDAVNLHTDLVANLQNWAGDEHRYHSLEVIDAATGRVIASTDAADEGKFREEQPYFINGLHTAFVQNPYYDLAEQRPGMTAAAPIVSPEGRVVAVLAGPLNMDEMNTIIQRRSGLHQTDDAFLVNTSNLFVTQPRLISNPAVLQRGVHTEAVNDCLTHKSGEIAALDYRNVPSFIVYRWMPERQLCLVVKMDQTEALAPVRALASTMAFSGGLVFLLGSIVALLMSRSIARPIRQLAKGAERIGQGDLDVRIEVRSEDEIGKLGIAFNHMASAIGEKNAQLRNWATDLELRVQERTSELRDSEERYRILSETSPDMIFVIDRQDRVLYANNLAYRQFGKTPDEVIGKNRSELFTPPVLEDQSSGLPQVLNSLQPYSSEILIASPTGQQWLETQLVPLRNAEGEVIAAMGVSRDITERKRIEEAVHQSEEQYRALFTTMMEGFCIIEVLFDAENNPTDYRFLETNTAFDFQTGLQAAKGKRMRELAPENEEYWYQIYGKVALTGESTRFVNESKVLKRWYDVTAYRVGGQASRKVAILFNDITEVKKAAEALAKSAQDLESSNKDLERSNKELERFAYVASHDLQEPLRMVTSYLQLLEMRYKNKLDSDANEFINYAVDGSNRMKTLINDLLAYSRVGMRGKEFNLTDCEEILSRALVSLEYSIKDNHARVTHDPLPKVMADEAQLESLFQNLIGNAIKFHGKKPPRIHVGVKKDEKNWTFSVSDNGIGIDPQYFERIFILFQRLHNRDDYPGTGIGLAISKRIVERHGGRIWIESEPEKGSTFYFNIPIKGG